MAQPDVRHGDDTPMARTYALVIVCHAITITLLWWVGRVFSR
jgi:hypothetical protein